MLIELNAELLSQPVDRWAVWYFDRPASNEPDSSVYDGEWDVLNNAEFATPEIVILERLAELHERYSEWTSRYSAEQLSQGMWAMFSYPGFLGELILSDEPSFELRKRALRSLIVPYRDFVQTFDPKVPMPHGWSMLWDMIFGHRNLSRDIADVGLEALQEILAIPDPRCQECALHGLNHLNHPDRPTVVQKWMNKNLTPAWNRGWVEACRDGKAM